MVALLAMSVGASQAAPIAAPAAAPTLLDLTPGEAEAGGSVPGGSVPGRSRGDIARASALRAIDLADGGLSGLTATGRADPSAVLGSVPPMAAARGTKDDAGVIVASDIAFFLSTDAYQKAAAVGRSRVAPLIGSVGGVDGPDSKRGGSVFVATANAGAFADDASMAVRFRNSPTAIAFGPGSTSTAAITVAAAGTLQRQQVPFISLAKSLQTTTPASGDTVQTVDASGKAKPAPEFTFVVNPPTGARGATSGASFGNWMTVRGTAPSIEQTRQTENLPLVPGAPKLQSVRAEPLKGMDARRDAQDTRAKPDLVAGVNSPRIETSSVAAAPQRLIQAQAQVPAWGTVLERFQTGRLEQEQAPIALTPSIPIAAASDPARPSDLLVEQMRALQIKGVGTAVRVRQGLDPAQITESRSGAKAQTDLSASVSIDPRSATMRRVLSNLDGGVPAVAARSVEAFLIGETAARTPMAKATTVTVPLQDKIVVSAGALNNFLALP